MGAVLTPLLAARHAGAAELADASTLCGACMDACPVQIPLQDLLLGLRRRRPRRRRHGSRARGLGGVGGGLVAPRRLPGDHEGGVVGPLARPAHRAWCPVPGGGAPGALRRCRRAAGSGTGGRTAMSERREHGDRTAFLRRVRGRLVGGAPSNSVHPPPPEPARVPAIVHLDLDRSDLEGSFVRAATEMGATVHGSDGADAADAVDAVVDAIVAAHGVRTAVVTAEPETADVVAARLLAAGVDVLAYDPVTAASADLGVTGAVAAVAATGSVVVDSALARGRGASLLPPVHLCVVPRDRVVATPAMSCGRSPPPPSACRRTWCSSPARAGPATSSRSSPSASTARWPCTTSWSTDHQAASSQPARATGDDFRHRGPAVADHPPLGAAGAVPCVLGDPRRSSEPHGGMRT